MKPLENPKKTIKFLYLYMTLPLLLVAGTLWVTTSFRSSSEVSMEKPAAAKSMEEFCEDDIDCGIGETCVDSGCVNPLRKMPALREPESEPDTGISSTGWATIITSVMAGLTGLLGAITQTVLAFLAVRRRRRSRE